MMIKAIQLRTITEGAPQSEIRPTIGLTYDTLERYTLDELRNVI